jgi:hypothetical protein
MAVAPTLLALLTLASVATAAEPTPLAPTPTVQSAAPAAPVGPAPAGAQPTSLDANSAYDGPLATQQHVSEMNDRLAGVGIGFDMGLWGDRFANGLKVDVPLGTGRLGQFFGVRLRGLVVHDDFEGRFQPVAAGGVELFGRSPVQLGALRVYGAGGLYYGATMNTLSGDAAPELVGGGHFGVEFAANKRQTFSFEVGGQGPISDREFDAGASVMAGTTIYLGKVGGR